MSLYPIGVMMGVVTKAYGEAGNNSSADKGASAKSAISQEQKQFIYDYNFGHWETAADNEKIAKLEAIVKGKAIQIAKAQKKLDDPAQINKQELTQQIAKLNAEIGELRNMIVKEKRFLLTGDWMRTILVLKTIGDPYDNRCEDQLLSRFTWAMVAKAIVGLKTGYGIGINDIQAGKLAALVRDANGGLVFNNPLKVLMKEWPLTGGQAIMTILTSLSCNQLAVYRGHGDSKRAWGRFPDKLRIQVPEGFEDALKTLLAPKPAPVYRPVRLPKRQPVQTSRPAELPKPEVKPLMPSVEPQTSRKCKINPFTGDQVCR